MSTQSSFRTVLDILDWVAPQGDQGYTFLEEDGSELTLPFPALIEAARARAGALQGLGLAKGDRLALVLPRAHDFVVTFLGAILAGVIPVPLYPPVSLGRLENYLKTTAQIVSASGAKVLITSKIVEQVLWTVTDEAPGLKKLLSVEKLSEPTTPFKPVTVAPEDVAFLQYTSGSTAAPKGVRVTHRSLVANAVGIMHDGLQARPHVDKGLSWLPLYHDMGLIGFVIAPMVTPVSVVFMPTLSFMKRPLQWLEQLHKHRATITFAPNFAYSLVNRRATDEHLSKWDLSSVRIAGCGAEPISAPTMRAFLERFGKAGFKSTAFLPAYGMAEATLAISFKTHDTLWRTDRVDGPTFRHEGRAVPATEGDDVLEFVSCGKPFPGHEVAVVDERGQRLPERVVGELVFEGPSVTDGYYHQSAATRDAFVDGRLLTGDLGYLADGEVYVTGRKKDLIIVNGRNYTPQSIEWVVEDVEGVRRGNVVAFARPGAQGTEELVIVCEARAEDEAALQKEISSRVSMDVGLPVGEVVILPAGALPKTTSGKVQRRKTRELYANGTLASAISTSSPNQTLQSAGHLLRAMASRFKHTVRNFRSDS